MRFSVPPASATLALVTATAALLVGQTPPPLIDNDQVRVVKVTDQPHVRSQPHDHKLNRVIVYLQPGREEVTPVNGKKVVLEWKAGDVRWSPAGGPHVTEVVSNAPADIVDVEIKKPGDPAKTVNTPLDPVKVASQNYKVEFENSQVRVTRVKLAPRQAVPVHEHVLNRVIVYLTDQNTRMTASDGKSEMARHKAGEVSWGSPMKHKESNEQDGPFEVVVVELKD